MLNFDDDLGPCPAAAAGAGHARDDPCAGSRRDSFARTGARPRRRAAGDGQRLPPRAHGGQARHQRLVRRQPAGAVQVPLGVGQVHRRLRQPLDAAGSEHAARHRAVEAPGRPDRRRAPDRQAQPRLLRHRRQPRRQQHRARHLSPHLGARVPAVPAAPGVRGGDPHARLPVHRREPGPRRSGDLQRLSRDQVDPRQGRVPDPVHRRAHQSALQDRHAGSRPGAAEEPDRVRLHHGRPLLLRRLRADPGDGPAEQDDGRLASSTSTSCATSRCTAASASTSSTRSRWRTRTSGRRNSARRSAR